jgi:hypothetical protein
VKLDDLTIKVGVVGIYYTKYLRWSRCSADVSRGSRLGILVGGDCCRDRQKGKA